MNFMHEKSPPPKEIILVVEDSPTQAEHLRYILEKKNFLVLVGRNGKEAIQMMEQTRPDLVISDITMPEMDGYELCQFIKGQEELKNIPVILLTSLSDAADVIRGIECGADNFLTKPFDEKYLFNRIQHLILNRQFYDQEAPEMGVHIFFKGQKYFITSPRLQILNLLLSTYEVAIQKNKELLNVQKTLKTLNDQLQSSNQELEAFSYSVSHDLLAPLRVIDKYAQILQQNYSTQLGPEGSEYVGRILRSGQKMGQLIVEMLKLAKVTFIDMNRQQLDLSAMAMAIASELQKSWPEREVHFSITPQMLASADRSLMQIVLENLINNAWKYTGKHPTAHIEFGQFLEDGQRIFYVRDDGDGFDMSFADRLFKAFQRLHPASEFTGSGIGLATVMRIIHRHGGKIWGEGALDKGATFYFTLE